MNLSKEDALARRIAEHLHATEGVTRTFGLVMEGAGLGWARCSMVVKENMTNGHNVCHGGVLFSLADNAFAWACNSRNVIAFAQSAAISFISPAKIGEKVTAYAHEEANEGRTGIYTVNITAEDGRTIAVFQGLSRTAGGAVVEG
ncbi:MAG: phenylacetic acid degradation protein PaaD [Alphaproteobacteria bacterium RIFCSPHIGHO2_12_FULL_63_12]|nr:MAG: phenylacetic acid degradation protein PaaD [Alphaproteobacteria bacterium RIFCSPHIGHO2_12_FULL_63_12]